MAPAPYHLILRTFLLGALMAIPAPGAAQAPAPEDPPEEIQQHQERFEALIPPARPVYFASAQPLESPAEGKGRMMISLLGNRKWCTLPDDRVVRPDPADPRASRTKDQVFTFGYQFTIAAIKRGEPTTPLMLYESPIIRTASWRNAAKVRQPDKQVIIGPGFGGGPPAGQKRGRARSDSLVPFWQEQYRCANLAENFTFDLDRGTYDVYMAFDLLNRNGGWVHRMVDYITDVDVVAGRRTVVEGRVHQGGASAREVELLSATIEEAGSPATDTP